MTFDRSRCAMIALHWVVGLVILAESSRFAFSASAAHAFAKTGLPNLVRLALGGSEMVAALLFLIPRTVVAGGWLLIVILGAAVVHLLHGWFDIGPLLVYAVATWAVITNHKALWTKTS
jgi:hypothetical protein